MEKEIRTAGGKRMQSLTTKQRIYPLRAIPEEINIKMNDLQGTVTSFVGKLDNLTTHINILEQGSDIVGSQLLKQRRFNSMQEEG